MDFEDQVLVRLATPSTRAEVFDQDALAAIVAAGYDLPQIEGPYSADFAGLTPAPIQQLQTALAGYWQRVGDPVPTDVQLVATADTATAPPPITALWRGNVVARVNESWSPVTELAVEQAGEPTGGRLDLRIGFAPAPAQTSPRALPVTVAVLARGAGGSLAGLIAESITAQRRIRDGSGGGPDDPDLPQRTAVVVVWVVPPQFFDDPDWPSPDATTPDELRAARRATAAPWLADLGIAVAVLAA
jgi:hypothetical protein